MYDIALPWEKTKKLECEGLLDLLQKLYPHYNLYSISKDWMKSPDFIAKAKGTGGDVVVGWTEKLQDVLVDITHLIILLENMVREKSEAHENH